MAVQRLAQADVAHKHVRQGSTEPASRPPRHEVVHEVLDRGSRSHCAAPRATHHWQQLAEARARNTAQRRAGMGGGAVTLHHLCCANTCAWVMYVQESIGASASEGAHFATHVEYAPICASLLVRTA